MSMSQEEIEALMNGLDIADDDETTSKDDNTTVNTDEIEELISQNEEVKVEETPKIKEVIKDDSSEIVNNAEIDSLLKDLETDNTLDEEPSVIPKSIEDLSSVNFDDVSADEEGIVESTTKTTNEASDFERDNNESIGKDWADSKISQGVFPFPADRDTKVVNQLSQVANDSEEKVSQIFDVLSLALDNNSEVRDKIESFESYITSELELLNSLSAKFPNIEVFNTQKELANKMSVNLKEISNIANSEDMKIFEAMELMQFNDINRQKIERVMSVIRKLSSYLNNLFEDDGSSQEIAVAKHIHGDKDHDLIGDDLDKLINEFKK